MSTRTILLIIALAVFGASATDPGKIFLTLIAGIFIIGFSLVADDRKRLKVRLEDIEYCWRLIWSEENKVRTVGVYDQEKRRFL